MSVRRYCGQRIENPVNNGEFYESSIGRYSIGDRTSVSIPVGLSFTVQNRPFINAEFESEKEKDLKIDINEPIDFKEEITIENVSFATEFNNKILENINLKIKKNSILKSLIKSNLSLR